MNKDVSLISSLLAWLICSTAAAHSISGMWRGFAAKTFDSSQQLCAASGSVRTEETGIMSYALDIFADEKTKKSKQIRTFNCTTSEDPVLFHQCTVGGAFCPVHSENIQDVVATINWPISPQICRSIHALERSRAQKITIYVLGGSVTIGRFSQGCCCNLDTANCPKHKNNADPLDPEQSNCRPNDFDERSVGGCGWLKHFKLWIEQKYSAERVEVKSLAIGGTTSVSLFLSEVSSVFSAPLSAHDIVFIDYSVNDVSQYGGLIAPDDPAYRGGVDVDLIIFGLQGLVRHFLDREPAIRPAVILIESWPHGLWHDYQFDKPDTGAGAEAWWRQEQGQQRRRDHHHRDYTEAYRAVARHYGLPVWSYRDAVNSPFVDREQGHIKEWITWGLRHVPMYALEHPHWHAHLFQADLMAGAFLATVTGCDDIMQPDTAASASVEQGQGRGLSKELFDRAVADELTLREPMKLTSAQLSVAGCQAEKVEHVGEALHVDAATEHLKQQQTNQKLFFQSRDDRRNSNSSSSSGLPYTDWHLSREKINKVGWISAYPAEVVTGPTAAAGTTSTSTATATATATALSEHIMSLPLNLTALQEEGDHRTGLILKIQFLTSYDNMGVVQVELCGRTLGYIDALWPDYNRTRHSLSRTALFSICAPCVKEEDCVPQLIYPTCSDWSRAALIITHKYLNLGGGFSSMRHGIHKISQQQQQQQQYTSIQASRLVRRQQKFKILSLNSCFISQMCAFPTMVPLKII